MRGVKIGQKYKFLKNQEGLGRRNTPTCKTDKQGEIDEPSKNVIYETSETTKYSDS